MSGSERTTLEVAAVVQTEGEQNSDWSCGNAAEILPGSGTPNCLSWGSISSSIIVFMGNYVLTHTDRRDASVLEIALTTALASGGF